MSIDPSIMQQLVHTLVVVKMLYKTIKMLKYMHY
jgi:hypothetical protein